MKMNPFRPNGLVSPGMFAGRYEELAEIDRALFQAASGNPRHFLIHGERGIGKSSLMVVADYTARGQLEGVESRRLYKFVTAKVELDQATTCLSMMSAIGRRLAAEIREIEPTKTLASNVWEYITRWEIAGVKYNGPPQEAIPSMADELTDTITRITQNYRDSINGVFIIIDEADKGGPDCQLGQFLKITTERLERNGSANVLFGLSGISYVVDVIRQSHESAPRILNHMCLQPLLFEERKEVIRKGLESCERVGATPVGITPEAEDWIAKYSEGFPHFIQQYASAAFDTDNDNYITVDDVVHGANKENGALDQLGECYFRQQYSDRINSDDYRKVLQVMAEHPDKYISKQHIRDATELGETTLGNALQALKAREIILPHPGKQGLYRLPTDSFALWIRMEAQRDEARHDKKAF